MHISTYPAEKKQAYIPIKEEYNPAQPKHSTKPFVKAYTTSHSNLHPIQIQTHKYGSRWSCAANVHYSPNNWTKDFIAHIRWSWKSFNHLPWGYKIELMLSNSEKEQLNVEMHSLKLA